MRFRICRSVYLTGKPKQMTSSTSPVPCTGCTLRLDRSSQLSRSLKGKAGREAGMLDEKEEALCLPCDRSGHCGLQKDILASNKGRRRLHLQEAKDMVKAWQACLYG